MRLSVASVLLAAAGAAGTAGATPFLAYAKYIRELVVIASNDDGGAEANFRAPLIELGRRGFKTIWGSAPAENESGNGNAEGQPTPRTKPCQYDSCHPAPDPVTGAWPSSGLWDASTAWVNALPVPAALQGLGRWRSHPGPKVVVSGVNYGRNSGSIIPHSGTCSIADEAQKAGVPGIAFSGPGRSRGPLRKAEMGMTEQQYTDPRGEAEGPRAFVGEYAALAADLLEHLAGQVRTPDEQVLPPGVWLNVNFPYVKSGRTGEECVRATTAGVGGGKKAAKGKGRNEYKWTLARCHPHQKHLIGASDGGEVLDRGRDDYSCRLDRLPDEVDVLRAGDCRIAVCVNGAIVRPPGGDPLMIAAAAEKKAAAAAAAAAAAQASEGDGSGDGGDGGKVEARGAPVVEPRHHPDPEAARMHYDMEVLPEATIRAVKEKLEGILTCKDD